MANRYARRRLLKNNMEGYAELFEKRGVNFISQYNTPRYKYPTAEQMSELTTVQHIWKTGDRLYKLAAKYYGDPTYWWVIAFYNQLPTEGHIQMGDLLDVPLPLDTILGYL